MKLNKSASEVLERYLLGVRRALTGKKREDIAKEIESSILDQLEERYPAAKEITDNQIKDVLGEMGSPHKLAAQFSPQRYLIGPQFFYAYTLVLRIVVPVVVGALLLSIIIGALAGENVAVGFPFWEYLGTLWNGAFMATAFVTLVFVIMERVNAEKDIEELKEFEQFKLEDLPELAAEEKNPSLPENIFEITFGVIGLAFFTYIINSGGQLPIFWSRESQQSILIFTESFMRFVPIMMALSGLEIARSATLAAQARHSSVTNWWHIFTQVASMVLTGFLLGSFPLITLEGFSSQPFTAGWDIARIDNGVHLGLKIIMILSLIGSGVEIIRRLFREVSNTAK